MATNGKYTLLQAVQYTLEALGSDDVNSISDSVEAYQIATLAKRAYYELLNQKEWPHLWKLRQLEAIADADHPNYLRIPDDVVRIEELKYDFTDPNGDAPDLLRIIYIPYCKPEEFLHEVQIRNTEQEDIKVITDFNGVKLPISVDNDAAMWTSFDDEYVVFDAYYENVESTLQDSKSQAMALCYPAFELTDSFVPDMPPHMFETWLAEVVSTAFIYMRQEVSPKDEQRARRGLAVLRRNASRSEEDDGKVKFGRNPR